MIGMSIPPVSQQDKRGRHRMRMMTTLLAATLRSKGWIFVETLVNIVRDFVVTDLGRDISTAIDVPWCCLGIQHSQYKKPISTKLRAITNLPFTTALSERNCGQGASEHVRLKRELAHQTDEREPTIITNALYNMLSATITARLLHAIGLGPGMGTQSLTHQIDSPSAHPSNTATPYNWQPLPDAPNHPTQLTPAANTFLTTWKQH